MTKMRTVLQVLVFTDLVAAMMIGRASNHDYHAGDLHLDHPWSRPTPPGTTVGANYALLRNDGDQPVHLVAALTPRATKVSIHETGRKTASYA